MAHCRYKYAFERDSLQYAPEIAPFTAKTGPTLPFPAVSYSSSPCPLVTQPLHPLSSYRNRPVTKSSPCRPQESLSYAVNVRIIALACSYSSDMYYITLSGSWSFRRTHVAKLPLEISKWHWQSPVQSTARRGTSIAASRSLKPRCASRPLNPRCTSRSLKPTCKRQGPCNLPRHRMGRQLLPGLLYHALEDEQLSHSNTMVSRRYLCTRLLPLRPILGGRPQKRRLKSLAHS